jgi:hypothetical protein
VKWVIKRKAKIQIAFVASLKGYEFEALAASFGDLQIIANACIFRIPIISLTSIVCGNRLPWNEIGGAAEGRHTILVILSLALSLDFIPRQHITTDY